MYTCSLIYIYIYIWITYVYTRIKSFYQEEHFRSPFLDPFRGFSLLYDAGRSNFIRGTTKIPTLADQTKDHWFCVTISRGSRQSRHNSCPSFSFAIAGVPSLMTVRKRSTTKVEHFVARVTRPPGVIRSFDKSSSASFVRRIHLLFFEKDRHHVLPISKFCQNFFITREREREKRTGFKLRLWNLQDNSPGLDRNLGRN